MSDITKPIMLDETGERLAEAMEEAAGHLAVIARAAGEDASGAIKSHKMTQTFVRAGTISKYVATGELYKVAKETGVSVTVVGDGVTAATVNEDTFIAKVGHADTHGYEFIFDGAAWRMEEEEAELTAYGITPTGTPVEGDIIVVHVTGSEVVFEILGTNDYDVPANSELKHTLPLISRDILSHGTIAFCAPQLLKVIAADEFPNGIAADTTLSITLDHACYDATTKQDGTVHFTTPVAIPVGGGIRHTEIGKYYGSASDYTFAKILSGTFSVYDADGTVIQSNIATSEGSEGTSLGACTAETPSYMGVTVHMNSTRRQMYGSNGASHQLDWLESSAAGAASGAAASWWKRHSEFDIPVKSTLPGWMHGLDPEFISVLCPVRKRTYRNPFDRTNQNVKYADAEYTVFQLSMTEAGFGANDGVYECGVRADGTVNKAEAYPLYKDATNEDRKKYEGATVRYWFLRSPDPSYAFNVRGVSTSGALNNSNARNADGVVAGLCIG